MRFSLNNFRLNSKVTSGLLGAAIVGGLVLVGGVVAPAVVQAMESQPSVVNVFQGGAPNGKALDTHLLRYGDNYMAIKTDASVSMDAFSSVVVRKIGYGETSFVTVTTTSSGVYSSDALASAHVRYPGVYVAQLQLEPDPFRDLILGWSRLTGWVKIPLLSADSFAFLDDTTVPASSNGVCVKDTKTGICR
jgi:hypothetical protein